MHTGRVMRFLPAVVLFSVLALMSSAASAAEDRSEDESAPPKEDTRADVSLRASVAGFDDVGANSGGLALGATALVRHGWFLAGGFAETGGAILDYSYAGFGPAAGISFPVPRWARIDLYAVGGSHRYAASGWNREAVDGNMGFIGARSYLGVELGGTLRFAAGLSPFVERDLAPDGLSRAGLAVALGGTIGL